MAVTNESKPPEESRNAGCIRPRRGHFTRHLSLDPERYPLHPVIEALRQTPPKPRLQVIPAVDEGEGDEEPQQVFLLEPVLSKGIGGEGGKDTADDAISWLKDEGRKISSVPPAAPAKEDGIHASYVDEPAARAPHEDTPDFEVEIDVVGAGVPPASEEPDAACEPAESEAEEIGTADEANAVNAEPKAAEPAEKVPAGTSGSEIKVYDSDSQGTAYIAPYSILEALYEVFADPATTVEEPYESAIPDAGMETQDVPAFRTSGVGELVEGDSWGMEYDWLDFQTSGEKHVSVVNAGADFNEIAPESGLGADVLGLPGADDWKRPANETITLELLVIDHQSIKEINLELRDNTEVAIGSGTEQDGIAIAPALEKHAVLTVEDGRDIVVEGAPIEGHPWIAPHIYSIYLRTGAELGKDAITGQPILNPTALVPGQMVRICSTLIAVTAINGDTLMGSTIDGDTRKKLHELMKQHATELSGLSSLDYTSGGGEDGKTHASDLPWIGGPDTEDGASRKVEAASGGTSDVRPTFRHSTPPKAQPQARTQDQKYGLATELHVSPSIANNKVPLPKRGEIIKLKAGGSAPPMEAQEAEAACETEPAAAPIDPFRPDDTGEAEEAIKKIIEDAMTPEVISSEPAETEGAVIVDEESGKAIESIDLECVLGEAAVKGGLELDLSDLDWIDDHTDDAVEETGQQAASKSYPPPVPATTALLLVERDGNQEFIVVSSDGNPISLVALGICSKTICSDDVTLGFEKGSLVLSNNLMGANVKVNGEKRDFSSAKIMHGDVLSVNGGVKATVYFMDGIKADSGGRTMNEGSARILLANRSCGGFESDEQVFWNRLCAMERVLNSLNQQIVPDAVAVWSSKLSDELRRVDSLPPERQKRAYLSAMDSMEHVVSAAFDSDVPLSFLKFVGENQNPAELVSAMRTFRTGAGLEEIRMDDRIVQKAIDNGMDITGTFEKKMMALLNSLPDDTLMRIKQGTLRCDLNDGTYECGKEGIMAVMNTMLYPRGIALLELDGAITLARASHMASDGDTDYIFVKPLNGQTERLDAGDGMPLAVFDMLPVKKYSIAEGLVRERRPGSPRNPKKIVMLAHGNPEENGIAARCGAQRHIDAISGYRSHIEGKYGAGSDKSRLYLSASALAAGLCGSGMSDKEIAKRLKKIIASRKSEMNTAAAMLQVVLEKDRTGSGKREALLRFLDDEYCSIGGHSIRYRTLFGDTGKAVVPDSNVGKRDPTPTTGGIVFALTGKISTFLGHNNGDDS